MVLRAVQETAHGELLLAQIAAETGLSEAHVKSAADALVAGRRLVCLAPLDVGEADGYMLPETWARIAQTTRRTLATYHKKNPYKKMMPLGELRGSLTKAATLGNQDLRRVAARLQAENALVWEPKRGVRLPEHAVVLPPGWEKAAREIQGAFESAGLNPPPPSAFEGQYPRDVNIGAILKVLTETGALLAVAENLYFAPSVVERLTQTARDLSDAPNGLTVASLRNATGSSRKIIVPLLEWMDAQGLTVRRGDTRVFVGKEGNDGTAL